MCWANEQEEAFHFRNSEGEAMQCSSVRPSDGPDDSFVLCDASKLVCLYNALEIKAEHQNPQDYFNNLKSLSEMEKRTMD
ncbi:hypothetical protein Tco_0759898 [Tanacetum coccineum]